MSMTHIAYDAITDTLQPREMAAAFVEKLAETVGRYIQPLTQAEAEVEAARIAAERQAMAERARQLLAKSQTPPKSAKSVALDETGVDAGIATPDGLAGSPPPTTAGSTAFSAGSYQSNTPLEKLLEFKVDQVADWVENNLGLPQYRDMLVRNAVDGLLLVELTDDDLLFELRIDDASHRARILGALEAVGAAFRAPSRAGTALEEGAQAGLGSISLKENMADEDLLASIQQQQMKYYPSAQQLFSASTVPAAATEASMPADT